MADGAADGAALGSDGVQVDEVEVAEAHGVVAHVEVVVVGGEGGQVLALFRRGHGLGVLRLRASGVGSRWERARIGPDRTFCGPHSLY